MAIGMGTVLFDKLNNRTWTIVDERNIDGDDMVRLSAPVNSGGHPTLKWEIRSEVIEELGRDFEVVE